MRRKRSPPKPMPERQRAKTAAAVKAALTAIDQYASGEVRMSEGGKEWYKEWYKGLREMKTGSPRLILYYNRKPIHLLRLAMLMRLPMKVLNVRDLEAAAKLLDWVELPLADVYKVIGMSKAGEMTRAVLDSLKSMGGRVAYKELAREMKGLLNRRDLRMAVDTLKEAGQLVEEESLMEHMLQLKELGLVE